VPSTPARLSWHEVSEGSVLREQLPQPGEAVFADGAESII